MPDPWLLLALSEMEQSLDRLRSALPRGEYNELRTEVDRLRGSVSLGRAMEIGGGLGDLGFAFAMGAKSQVDQLHRRIKDLEQGRATGNALDDDEWETDDEWDDDESDDDDEWDEAEIDEEY